MPGKVVVVGSYNTDLTIKTERIPRHGETVIGGTFSWGAGGKGANQAVAALRAGATVGLIAKLGNDTLGQEALARLQAESINTEHVFLDSSASTGVAFIIVDKEGENSIIVASGANSRLAPSDVGRAEDTISSANILLVQLESPMDTVQAAVEIGHRHGVTVILNPAPARPIDPHLLDKVDIITPNAIEVEMLAGIKVHDEKSLQNASQRLLGLGVRWVLITLGSKGVFCASNTGSELIPAFSVQAVDSTGAGDVFSGALAAFLAEGVSVEDAARMACAAAAIAVTRMGAQTSVPHRWEIDNFFRTNMNLTASP